MRMLAFGFLLGLLVAGCGNAHAQITVDSIEQVCVVEPDEKIETAGSRWVIPADTKLTLTPAAIVRLKGLDGFNVKAKPILLDSSKPISVTAMDASTWLVSGSSRVFLSVTAIDFERELFENEVITVDIEKEQREEDTEPEDDKDEDQSDDGRSPLVAKAIVFVEETLDRAKHPEQTTAMLDAQLWETLKGMGLDVQVVDDDEPDPRWQRIIGQVTPRPAMVIVENPDSIRVFEVPMTADEIERTVRGNIVR